MLSKQHQLIATKRLKGSNPTFMLENYQYLGDNAFKFKYSDGYYLRVSMQPDKQHTRDKHIRFRESHYWP